MNPRIQKLYDQCFVVLENQSPNTGFDLEKFAELIVKECISVMKSTVDESIDIDRKLDETYYWIKSDIKNHFWIK